MPNNVCQFWGLGPRQGGGGALVKQANTDVVQFVRYEVGEGIEVEEADFAAEVAAQLADSE